MIKKEIKIGIFFVSSVLIFYFGVLFLKKSPLFSNENNYYFTCEDLKSLKKGDLVFSRGINLGNIKTISLMDDFAKKIKVSFSVKKNIKITNKSFCQITPSIISGIGNSFLQIIITEQGEILKNNSEIIYKEDLGMKEIITPTIKSVEELLFITNKFIIEVAKNTENVFKIIKNIEKMSFKLDFFLEKNLNNFTSISKNISELLENLKNPNYGIEAIFIEFNKLMKTINSENILITINNINSTAIELNNILKMIQNKNGIFYKLFQNTEFYDNLNKTIKSADNFLVNLKEEPSKYVHFSLFGKKNEKK
jgi:phospholipid/cholesterol/gamma-HCH transport system substrate-binding protein